MVKGEIIGRSAAAISIVKEGTFVGYSGEDPDESDPGYALIQTASGEIKRIPAGLYDSIMSELRDEVAREDNKRVLRQIDREAKMIANLKRKEIDERNANIQAEAQQRESQNVAKKGSLSPARLVGLAAALLSLAGGAALISQTGSNEVSTSPVPVVTNIPNIVAETPPYIQPTESALYIDPTGTPIVMPHSTVASPLEQQSLNSEMPVLQEQEKISPAGSVLVVGLLSLPIIFGLLSLKNQK